MDGQPRISATRFSRFDRLARWWLIRRGLLIDLQPRALDGWGYPERTLADRADSPGHP